MSKVVGVNKKSRVLDPCCGSGHILVYAFEVFYQIYLQQGYNKNDIPKLILEKNIYGLDIDNRAGQLSILSLLLKAREFDKNIFNKIDVKSINVYSMQESNSISQFCIEELNNNRDKAEYLVEKFKDGKEIGSLLLLNKDNYDDLINEIKNTYSMFGLELQTKLLPIIQIAKILQSKFDVIVTNPPYAIKAKLGKYLYNYISKEYSGFSNDLFTAFIKRMDYFMDDTSVFSMITPHSWMTLGDLENIRNHILNQHHILSMAHMGVGAFGADFGTTAFVVENCKNTKIKSVFVDLTKWS